jgi:hypothetical protein
LPAVFPARIVRRLGAGALGLALQSTRFFFKRNPSVVTLEPNDPA